MEKIVWKTLRKRFALIPQKILLQLKVRLLRNEYSLTESFTLPKKTKTKLPMLPVEAERYRLMGEIDRSIGIEQWARGRKYQTA